MAAGAGRSKVRGPDAASRIAQAKRGPGCVIRHGESTDADSRGDEPSPGERTPDEGGVPAPPRAARPVRVASSSRPGPESAAAGEGPPGQVRRSFRGRMKPDRLTRAPAASKWPVKHTPLF